MSARQHVLLATNNNIECMCVCDGGRHWTQELPERACTSTFLTRTTQLKCWHRAAVQSNSVEIKFDYVAFGFSGVPQWTSERHVSHRWWKGMWNEFEIIILLVSGFPTAFYTFIWVFAFLMNTMKCKISASIRDVHCHGAAINAAEQHLAEHQMHRN